MNLSPQNTSDIIQKKRRLVNSVGRIIAAQVLVVVGAYPLALGHAATTSRPTARPSLRIVSASFATKKTARGSARDGLWCADLTLHYRVKTAGKVDGVHISTETQGENLGVVANLILTDKAKSIWTGEYTKPVCAAHKGEQTSVMGLFSTELVVASYGNKTAKRYLPLKDVIIK